MRKKVIASIALGAFTFVALSSAAKNILLSFFLAGVIPGTHVIIPFWFMMAVYCASISLIVASYLEIGLRHIHRQARTPVPKTRPTHRRYTAL